MFVDLAIMKHLKLFILIFTYHQRYIVLTLSIKVVALDKSIC